MGRPQEGGIGPNAEHYLTLVKSSYYLISQETSKHLNDSVQVKSKEKTQNHKAD